MRNRKGIADLNVDDIIDEISDVQEQLRTAIEQLRGIVRGTPYEDHTDAYAIGNIESLIDGDPSSLEALKEWILNDAENDSSEDDSESE